MEAKNIQWFIEPTAEFDNQKIYQNLSATNRPTEDSLEIRDSKGKNHEVWLVDFDFIKYLLSQHVSLKIYLKQGDVIQRWRLLEPLVKFKKRRRKGNENKE